MLNLTRKIFALFLIVVLLSVSMPIVAQDGQVSSEGEIVWTLSQVAIMLALAVVGGGGGGYILRAIAEARDERFMTLLENQYNQSNDALKQTVATLESVTRYLATSVPMTDDFRRQFLSVADFVDEVSDGVPMTDKTPLADSPSVTAFDPMPEE